MTLLLHIIKDLWRNLYRNMGALIGSAMSLIFLFLLFDLFWVAAGTSERFYSELLSELRVEAFVSETVADTSLPRLQDKLVAVDGVMSIEYVSRESARKELTRMVGTDLLIGYDSANPLPRSFILSFESDHLTLDQMEGAEDDLKSIGGVSQLHYSKQWLEKAETTKSIIFRVGLRRRCRHQESANQNTCV